MNNSNGVYLNINSNLVHLRPLVTRYSKIKWFSLIKEFVKDPDRKSIHRIILEIIYLALLHREFPRHYFSRYLFKKTKTNLSAYLPNNFLYAIKSRFNEQSLREVLDNKLYFDFYYKPFNIKRPNILMYNYRNLFVIGKSSFNINNVDDFRNVLEKLMEDNGFIESLFIKKSYHSYHGNNVYKIYFKDLTENFNMVQELFSIVIQTGYLFQETIRQHQVLEKLNPSCVNTIRLDTLIDMEGKIEIISGYLKTNIKNHFIDNEKSSGCEIPIDILTGKLGKYGHLTILYNGFKLPTEHPVTKKKFENFLIPHFNEAKDLVVKAASYVPAIRLVGWDVAIGVSGPILIEGNPDYSIPASDLAYGGYRSSPVFQKVLKEVNYY